MEHAPDNTIASFVPATSFEEKPLWFFMETLPVGKTLEGLLIMRYSDNDNVEQVCRTLNLMLQNPARFMRAFLRLLGLTNVSVPRCYSLGFLPCTSSLCGGRGKGLLKI